MENLFRPKSTLLALLMFLPITPSIAAITVFTKSVFIDKTENLTPIFNHYKRSIESTRN